jgi:hypothetical protein
VKHFQDTPCEHMAYGEHPFANLEKSGRPTAAKIREFLEQSLNAGLVAWRQDLYSFGKLLQRHHD